jgi:hypothetical protein
MMLSSNIGEIEIVNEDAYSFGSPDNARKYPFEQNFADNRYTSSSVHGILLNGNSLAVFGAGGGATCVHKHSAIVAENCLYLAVGDRIVCIDLTPFRFKWSVEADSATCFGVYLDKKSRTLLSHGELQIGCFSQDGQLKWTTGGEDIFTGDFELLPEYIRVKDFNNKEYRFSYHTGKTI